ncbi:MAG: PEP-CTERM sorting domain-containing protein [Puniceicoccales bacterium]|jgi:hypothetical protein|nr:PEP-CTERM sorting domain-containing protein [Puniceicoccales bacterium]
MKKTALVAASACYIVMTASSNAAVIAKYIDGSDYSDTSTPVVNGFVSQLGVTPGDMTVSGLNGGNGGPVRSAFGISYPSVSGGAGANWYTFNMQFTPVSPVSSSNYFTFTLTGNGAQAFDLTQISFDWLAANSTTTADTYNFGYQIFIETDKTAGSFISAHPAVTELTTLNATSYNLLPSQTVNMSGIAEFQGINSATIRIALADSTSTGTDVSLGGVAQAFSNITVEGVASIPEPSTYAVAGGLIALAAGMVVRRRRKN